MAPLSRKASRALSTVLKSAGTAAALLLSLLPAAAPAAAAPYHAGNAPADRYIVTLADQPLATYDGGTGGLAATKPIPGRKLEVTTVDAKQYRAHLRRKQTEAAEAVGATVGRHYTVTLNSFAAKLTIAQAVRLAAASGVTSVVPDELHRITSDQDPTDFLRLTGPAGIWKSLGGAARAGEGIVIGDIDTGIWPESASFAAPALSTDRPPPHQPYTPYLDGASTVLHKADGSTFTGTCQIGEGFAAADCNHKIISARYFGDGWNGWVPEANRADYLSPRDAQGHGTHTAATAAGNAGVRAIVDDRDFGNVSGVAPGAAIAVYKAMWHSKDGHQTGGLTSDLVAAVDQAVADGVDIINYSIGSVKEARPNDPVQQAFLNAASAGVFISTSGGNSGPGPSTLSNTSPWTTTAAAGTVAPYKGSVVLGNGSRYTGISSTVTTASGPKPLSLAAAVKRDGTADGGAAMCLDGTLDPALAAGRIIVCNRGINGRTEKSAEVARAGGVGMILTNMTDLDTSADLHSVPTVHLNTPAATDVWRYAASADATASLIPGGDAIPYPQVAGFSSRGPALTSNGDILKPDITAPGVSILAAVAPPANSGHRFAFYSGTSMAAPHISGLAALLLDRHPTWSPMRVKSAMMTTAMPTTTATDRVATDAYAQGAGEIEAQSMFRPGLVYEADQRDWLAYLEGLGLNTGSGAEAVDASDLNQPSIAIGALHGAQTVTRTVTAVSPGAYRANVNVPGVAATVDPPVLRFARAGQRRTFTVRFDVTTAAAGVPANGSLTWSRGGTSVRSPIVVTPQSVRAPVRVTGSGTTGELTYTVTPLVSPFKATVHGPTSSPPSRGMLNGTEEYFETSIAAGTKAVEFTAIAENPTLKVAIAYWRVDPAEQLSGGQIVLPDSHGVVTVTLPRPEGGEYRIAVVPYTTSATPFTFQINKVTAADDATGQLRVVPSTSSVTPGAPLPLTAAWSGLPTTRSTAWIEYPNGAGTVASLN
ncbi:S8 family serine peptidase [Streptomyces sp. NPDC001675]